MKSGVEYLAKHPGWKSAKRKPRKRLARLTPEEDRLWVALFEHAVHSLKYGGLRADAYTWRHLCEAFPRLRKFHGAKP